MNHPLPLDKMSIDEKLETMEALWEDLSKSVKNLASPEWHETILKERDQGVEEGKDEFVSWEQAKKDINNKR